MPEWRFKEYLITFNLGHELSKVCVFSILLGWDMGVVLSYVYITNSSWIEFVREGPDS